MSRVLLLTTACVVALAVPVTAAESVFSRYRGVALGDSVQAVVDQLEVTASDVKVVHERPTLVQQLTWRPHRFISGVTVEPDPVAEMVLTFHLGLLARIAVIYDRDRTEGLTDVDLHEALTSVYGSSMLVATPMQTTIAARTKPEAIGRWGDAETLVVLWREAYPNRVRLTITSIAADRAMQDAIADGVRLDTSEAPGRELARRTAEAAAVGARDEKVRRDNKATFRP